jgi:hypothetical protein
MRLIVASQPGVLEFNFMWVPTFIGHDPQLKKLLEEKLKPVLEGQVLTEELLDKAHETILDLIVERFSAIKGLRDYLDAIKFVES